MKTISEHARSWFLPVFVFVSFSMAHAGSADPLESWRDTPNKKAITAFVKAVTTKGGPDFVPREFRIATFDMDGTILVEKPEAANNVFVNAYLKDVGKRSPGLADVQPYKAVLEHDTDYLARNMVLVLTTAFMGTTQEVYRKNAVDFAESYPHPRFKRPYMDLFYQPMLELMDYLRENNFQVFVVSGSGQAFVRSLVKHKTGLPNGRLIGTQTDLTFEYNEKSAAFCRNGSFRGFGTAGDGKPLIIEYQIGEKPILAFGNSLGDQEMFEYTAANHLRHLVLCLNHDDAAREYAYENSVQYQDGWLKVSMKKDFAVLFEAN